MMLQMIACTLGASVIPSGVMRNLALGIMGSWALIMLRKSKLMAMKLGILLTSIISLGVMQKLGFDFVGSEKPCMS